MPPKSKQSKANTTIVVALIGLAGTLITVLFTSPVLIELIKRSGATPTATSPSVTSIPPASAVLIFEQYFEDETTSGFAFRSGEWRIIRDKSNPALEFTAVGSEIPAAKAIFGPSDISDSLVEFRVKFKQLSGMYMDFRDQTDGSSYAIALDPNDSVVMWATNIFDGSNWEFSEIGPATAQSFTFQEDVWYTVRVEARGQQVILNINGNRVLSGTDARFASGGLRFELQPGAVILLDDVRIWSFDR